MTADKRPHRTPEQRQQLKRELDDQGIAHARRTSVYGVALPLITEGLVFVLGVSAQEDTPYWYNALSVLVKTDIDWSYLLRRATRDPERMLSLLAYARGVGLSVPREVLTRLCEGIGDGSS